MNSESLFHQIAEIFVFQTLLRNFTNDDISSLWLIGTVYMKSEKRHLPRRDVVLSAEFSKYIVNLCKIYFHQLIVYQSGANIHNITWVPKSFSDKTQKLWSLVAIKHKSCYLLSIREHKSCDLLAIKHKSCDLLAIKHKSCDLSAIKHKSCDLLAIKHKSCDLLAIKHKSCVFNRCSY